MNTRTETIPQMTIEEFADSHGLEMVVRERKRPENDPSRYYASFDGAEVKEGAFLASAFGDGPTPEKAIADYAKRISLTRLVLNAYKSSRQEFDVPRLIL